jgi:ABC-type branched-subunit amino acid transport system ATPase component
LGKTKEDSEFEGFEPSIVISSMSFKYPGSNENVLKNISLSVNSGEFIAIVGPSGSGKTTLVDLILGILKQDTGNISISGMKQEKAIDLWPGSISYVPQDIYVANSTIAENIAIGYDKSQYSITQINESIVMSSLDSFVNSQDLGMNFKVGENGSNLSGGQRQRLGIARALYSKPKMIFLDEATSALDSTTEAEISNEILKLKGRVTLIVVAHRLSTVINADRVVYLEDGEVKGIGTFQELRTQVPNFDENAKIAGY